MGKDAGGMISRGIQCVMFVQECRADFGWLELSNELECTKRTALRWMRALESHGLIERYGHGNSDKAWRRVSKEYPKFEWDAKLHHRGA